jgi:hypothetical protein
MGFITWLTMRKKFIFNQKHFFSFLLISMIIGTSIFVIFYVQSHTHDPTNRISIVTVTDFYGFNSNDFSMIRIEAGPSYPAGQLIVNDSGNYGAVSDCKNRCYLYVRDMANDAWYFLQSPSFTLWDPFDEIHWNNDTQLEFIQWTTAHQAYKYRIDVVNQRLVSKLTMTDATPTSTISLPTNQIFSRLIQPTLTGPESQEKIALFNQTNGDCQLPCIWGIKPGITRMDNAENLFRVLGWRINFFTVNNHPIIGSGQDVPIGEGFEIYTKDNIVEGMEFSIQEQYADQVTALSFSNVIISLEEPDQIHLYSAPPYNKQSSRWRVILTIYFGQSNVHWEYLGSAQVTGGIMNVCPTKHLIITEDLDLFSIGLKITTGSEKATGSPEKLLEPFNQYASLFGKPLEEVTDYTISSWIADAKQKGDNFCFQVSTKVWEN